MPATRCFTEMQAELSCKRSQVCSSTWKDLSFRECIRILKLGQLVLSVPFCHTGLKTWDPVPMKRQGKVSALRTLSLRSQRQSLRSLGYCHQQVMYSRASTAYGVFSACITWEFQAAMLLCLIGTPGKVMEVMVWMGQANNRWSVYFTRFEESSRVCGW